MPDLVSSDTYNKLFTMHGIIMVFLFLVPSVPATIGNFVLPIMVGAQGPGLSQGQPAELVPLYRGRRLFTVTALILGGVDTGWTFTTPL